MLTAQLTVLEGSPRQVHQIFLLNPQAARLLGRSSVCHFRLEDPLVSSLHCDFVYQGNNFILQDLVSANGVLINGNFLDSSALRVGDLIKVGKTLLEFGEFKGQQENMVYVTGDKPDISSVSDLVDKGIDEEKLALESPGSSRAPLGRMIKKSRDLNICRIALKNHLLNHGQIRKLLELQKEEMSQGNGHDLAEIAIVQNWLGKEQTEKLLQEHQYYKSRHKDIQFGQAVAQQKWANEEKIQECLALQEHYFHENGQIHRLGEILIQKGYLTVQQNNRLIKALKEIKLKTD